MESYRDRSKLRMSFGNRSQLSDGHDPETTPAEFARTINHALHFLYNVGHFLTRCRTERICDFTRINFALRRTSAPPGRSTSACAGSSAASPSIRREARGPALRKSRRADAARHCSPPRTKSLPHRIRPLSPMPEPEPGAPNHGRGKPRFRPISTPHGRSDRGD